MSVPVLIVSETAVEKSIKGNLLSHIFNSGIRGNAFDLEIYEFLVSVFPSM